MPGGHSGPSDGDHHRDPCPYSVVNDIGVGFCMGSIGGSIWHGFKGYRNSPRGDRFNGMLTSIKVRAPVLGGNFAVWSGMFNAGDCLLAGLRGKQDVWNPIMAGAATGALLSIRSGPRAMIASGIVGGIILSVMEGVGVMMNRMSADSMKPQAPMLPELPEMVPPPPQPLSSNNNNNTTTTTTTESSSSYSTMNSSTSEFVTETSSSSLPEQQPKPRFGFFSRQTN